MNVFLFALLALFIVVLFFVHVRQQAQAFGWINTVIEFIAAGGIAVLIGHLAAAGVQ
jgi:hypothetical protein